MWPLLCTSFVALTVVLERLLFLVREKSRRQPEVVENILGGVDRGDVAGAMATGNRSQEFIARWSMGCNIGRGRFPTHCCARLPVN